MTSDDRIKAGVLVPDNDQENKESPYLNLESTKHNTQYETIYLAGGCFWGLEDILRNIPGVLNTEAGYTGG